MHRNTLIAASFLLVSMLSSSLAMPMPLDIENYSDEQRRLYNDIEGLLRVRPTVQSQRKSTVNKPNQDDWKLTNKGTSAQLIDPTLQLKPLARMSIYNPNNGGNPSRTSLSRAASAPVKSSTRRIVVDKDAPLPELPNNRRDPVLKRFKTFSGQMLKTAMSKVRPNGSGSSGANSAPTSPVSGGSMQDLYDSMQKPLPLVPVLRKPVPKDGQYKHFIQPTRRPSEPLRLVLHKPDEES
ncbi:hypothetical protein BDF22DRAFT_666650, partial [Syncephalis plumigaleata]